MITSCHITYRLVSTIDQLYDSYFVCTTAGLFCEDVVSIYWILIGSKIQKMGTRQQKRVSLLVKDVGQGVRRTCSAR